MLDGVLVLNEFMGFAKKKKNKCLSVQVDFQKDYDCVS